ncbi:MAG TPA: DPP IV N-terminal domain-containing protein [Chthonomonadaceae bacterium]|nr:DPP IV N-terminal domain-containing protein [Chthonomonadaceae bacterium]
MRTIAIACFAAYLLGASGRPAPAQQRLSHLPAYQQFQKMRGQIADSYQSGALEVTWVDGGKAFEYDKDDKRYRYDIAAGKAVQIGRATPGARPTVEIAGQIGATAGPQVRLERGRQAPSALSPDGKHTAFTKDRNLWLSDADGANAFPVTTDGSTQTRIKYATASWVYGEELEQRSAMWWSPDSRKIAFYRFDESKVLDYYLELDNLKPQSRMDVEPFVLAGAPNPVVDILIYDLASKQVTPVDARDGKPFDDAVVGHYVYGVQWSHDGKALLFHRTNRRQNILEFAAADPESGKCRVVFRDEWPASWTETSPPMRWLSDNRRFILTSERNGWRNLYLYDLDNGLIAPLTQNTFEVEDIVRVDEGAGLLYYMGRDGDNHLKLQLHRVGLDGKGDRRLTDPAFYHHVDIAPDGRHFIDVYETHNTPPATRLMDADGKILAELAKSDLTKFNQLGLEREELLTFHAADGKTTLYGMLSKPSHFNPNRKYPILVTIYSGPETSSAHETFSLPSALTELGVLVASFDSRGGDGRGKRFKDAIYGSLGVTEIDDQAAGLHALCQRPYVDSARTGIFGTSYGGYASVMCLLRYPKLFQAACGASSVTDWRNYDSIYTERYMWIPQENKAGYDAGSAMTYADKLQGRLMLYYGTADNNVHPSNTLQLVHALQQANKSFEVQVGPDLGHSALRFERMLEFFLEAFGLLSD